MEFNFDFIALNIDYNNIIDSLYENITFEFFIKCILVYIFIIWVSVFIRVLKDISNRTDSILLQLISILIILIFTPLGIFLYFIIRPSNTLLERYYKEIDHNLDIIAEFVEEYTQKQQIPRRTFRKKNRVMIKEQNLRNTQ